MDFLLECIGFPPEVGNDELVDLIRARGEPAPWRGDGDRHLVLALGDGLEVRADRDEGQEFWALSPHFRVPQRRRLAVTSVVRPPDSPFDALLRGWADPPPAGEPGPAGEDVPQGSYRMATWVSDARRIDRRLAPGHVLAVSIAGFALHVDRVVPNAEAAPPSLLERPAGALIRPLGGPQDPGGCCDVSLRVRAVQGLLNDVTSRTVQIVLCDAPDRPLALLISPWQMRNDGLPEPRPGMRIEGTFLFTGRIAGGLKQGRRRTFG